MWYKHCHKENFRNWTLKNSVLSHFRVGQLHLCALRVNKHQFTTVEKNTLIESLQAITYKMRLAGWIPSTLWPTASLLPLALPEDSPKTAKVHLFKLPSHKWCRWNTLYCSCIEYLWKDLSKLCRKQLQILVCCTVSRWFFIKLLQIS